MQTRAVDNWYRDRSFTKVTQEGVQTIFSGSPGKHKCNRVVGRGVAVGGW